MSYKDNLVIRNCQDQKDKILMIDACFGISTTGNSEQGEQYLYYQTELGIISKYDILNSKNLGNMDYKLF